MGDGGGGHWLVQMEWRPAGWSVCLPLLIFTCTIKSRSSLLVLAHPGDPGKRAVNSCDDGIEITDRIRTSGYATWFTAGGAIRIAHYDVTDDVITRKL